jgi:serine/threonine-protein kinase HipA
MTDQLLFVYVDLDGTPILAGRLYGRRPKGQESASFEYDRGWIDHPRGFALDPALPLATGSYHTAAGRALFGAIGDSAPDRWGRTLMRRAERRQARAENRQPRSFGEVDFLIHVDDETRMGAYRYAKTPGGLFLAAPQDKSRVPPLLELPRLLNAADQLSRDDEGDDGDDDLRLILAPGSSLGGARPKASVRDTDGRLLIAKFSAPDDEINLPKWESIALTLAEEAGLTVARHRLTKVGDRSVLLLERFDRNNNAATRLPFQSAMTLLGAVDNETRSYLEIAAGIRQFGAAVAADLAELWRRIVFSILISNTDDHLRNHGFLRHGFLRPNRQGGWRLSPAYDLNPMPPDIRPRILSTAIDEEDTTASIDLALSVAPHFGLKLAEAKHHAAEVARAVSSWRHHAAQLGLSTREIDRMAGAFDHADTAQALG